MPSPSGAVLFCKNSSLFGSCEECESRALAFKLYATSLLSPQEWAGSPAPTPLSLVCEETMAVRPDSFDRIRLSSRGRRTACTSAGSPSCFHSVKSEGAGRRHRSLRLLRQRHARAVLVQRGRGEDLHEDECAWLVAGRSEWKGEWSFSPCTRMKGPGEGGHPRDCPGEAPHLYGSCHPCQRPGSEPGGLLPDNRHRVNVTGVNAVPWAEGGGVLLGPGVGSISGLRSS